MGLFFKDKPAVGDASEYSSIEEVDFTAPTVEPLEVIATPITPVATPKLIIDVVAPWELTEEYVRQQPAPVISDANMAASY